MSRDYSPAVSTRFTVASQASGSAWILNARL
jgi:hypothetical protein